MEAEKVYQEKTARTIRQKQDGSGALQFVDNRGINAALQRMGEDEEEGMQMKAAEPVQKQKNETGIPNDVKQKMEDAFSTDFSNVRIHPESSQAPEVGALAYTQGTDIHFAPGQFKPETSAGQQLLGHELTHVVQQAEGRVQATTEINGMPVNDNEGLEHEADALGAWAAR